MRADAIVVAYRSRAIIGDCTKALRSDPAIDRIIVVNNSPGDGTSDGVQADPALICFDSPGNVGFGSAVNSARAHLRNAYVVLANPDATQSSTTTSEAIGFLAEHPRAALVAPRMFHPDGSLYRNSHHNLSIPRMFFGVLGWPRRFGLVRTPRDHHRAHRSDYVTGSFVVCRREALDLVDWFDESIFLFGEDQDLELRLRHAGWEIWYAPLGRVVHLSGHSWRQLPDQGRSLFVTARYTTLLKARGQFQAEIYRTVRRLRRREWREGTRTSSEAVESAACGAE